MAAARGSYSILGQPGPIRTTGGGVAAADGPAKDGNVATKLDLSFGIKLEFFSAMKRAAFQKKAARHSRNLRELIGHEMRRRKMQGKSGKVALIHIPTDAELDAAAGGDIDAPYGAWVITRETSIDPDHPEWFDDYEAQPIKIISPPYLGLAHWGEFETDIQTLLGTASEEEDDADLYCELNASTHFHVEIGNATDEGGFDLDTVKRLAILVLGFEKEIDKMLGDHMGYIYESLWAGSQQLNPAFRDLSTTASCHRIWRECKTIEDVANMMCPDLPKVTNPDFRHYYKYNFMTLLSETPTIEFRQHEGTINAEEIIRWVKFVSGLVDLAHNIDIQNLARLVHLTDTKPVSFTELCAAMVIFGSMNPDDQHVLHYTRKINARGENLHTRTYMKYMEETPHVCWRDVSESRKDPDAREFQ